MQQPGEDHLGRRHRRDDHAGRRGWARAIRATLGPFTVTARSPAAARQGLQAAVQRFLEEWHEPQLVSLGAYTAVVHVRAGAEGPGFEYLVRRGERVAVSCSGFDSWPAAVDAARRHLAQIVTDYGDDESVRTALAFLSTSRTGSSTAAEFARYVAWQRAAQAAVRAGEPDPHRWAGEHQRDYLAAVTALL